jgi:hypothetical protein
MKLLLGLSMLVVGTLALVAIDLIVSVDLLQPLDVILRAVR